MFGCRVLVAAPVVGVNEEHQECACVGVVVAVPDGKLLLDFAAADDLETLGWELLRAAEELKRRPAPDSAGKEHHHA